jgi:lambda family phage portal protein
VDTTSDELYSNILMQPVFEGAARDYTMGLRGLHNGSSDSLAVRNILYLQQRVQSLIRNNGHASSAVDKHVKNMSSIRVNWIDKKGRKHNRMQDLWEEFASNPNLDGLGTLDNTQALWQASLFIFGNMFTRFQIRRTKNYNKIPLKLEVISPDLHYFGYMGDGREDTRFGITFHDKKPIKYHFFPGFPEEFWNGRDIPLNNITNISSDEIIHVFHRRTPAQWIGLPTLTPVIIGLYSIDDLRDATLKKQLAAQAVAWIIKNNNSVQKTPIGAPGIELDNEKRDKIVFKASGGNVQYLNKGEDIAFYQSTDIGPNLEVLIKSELQKISSTLGLPYYQLTGDVSGIDFSTLRGIAIDLRNHIEHVHHFQTIPLALMPLCNKFQDLAKLYDSRVGNAIPTFQLPRWRGVDELKDTQADLLEVQAGFSTLKSKLDERHVTPEEIDEDRKLIQALGLNTLLEPNNKSIAQSTNIQPNSNSNSG